MPGNHDIWVPGGPPGDQYDQYAWGLQQFYAQDTVASLTSPFLDFSGGGPDVMKDWGGPNNYAANSFFYHMIGNLGFIGYNGAIAAAEQRPFLGTYTIRRPTDMKNAPFRGKVCVLFSLAQRPLCT
jgi:3',5'-cyclic AMP phosphodiesterase CpdA